MRVIGLCKRLYKRLFNVRLRRAQDQPVPTNPFPIDAWTDQAYAAWFERHRATDEELARQRETAARFAYRPVFSLIVPLYKTPLDYLEVMADSVLAQTYAELELVLVNASPEIPELARAVEELRDRDGRVRIVTLEGNRGITENTNAGLEVATGEFCCFLDHDDYIEPDLLFEYARSLNDDPEIDVLYCDEDLVSYDEAEGAFQHLHPLFKPAYSPELLLCKNYIVHLMTVRRSIIDAMPRPDARFDGAQDYNMILFATSQARKVHNVSRVLYHWRISDESTAAKPEAKPYSRKAYRLSAARQMERAHIPGRIVASGVINIHNIWLCSQPPRISLVVDASDTSDLERFLEFFQQTNTFENVETLLVGNAAALGSALRRAAAGGCFPKNTRAVDCGEESTRFARFNVGAREATGDVLVFLDASCDFLTPQPLEQLAGLLALSGVGVVAPRTLFLNGRVKGYGIAVTGERIMPLYRGYEDEFPGYQCNLRAFQDVSAVGYQGLSITRSVFERLGGFDDKFEGEIGSAELCHRVGAMGLRCMVTPTVKLEVDEACPELYYVATDNAADFTAEDLDRFDAKWPGVRLAGDSYLSPNLDQSSSYLQVPHEVDAARNQR